MLHMSNQQSPKQYTNIKTSVEGILTFYFIASLYCLQYQLG